MCFRFISLLVCVLWYGGITVQAQERPVGYWRSHLPYNNAIGVATDGSTVFAISQQSFFSYNVTNGELSSYSKVDGMVDVGMSQIAYDAATNTVVLAYQSTDIDLFKDNSFYNMPDIRIKIFTGAKTINNIYTDRGMAYVSTTLGIVVLNLEKREVKETYVFTKNNQTIGINALTADDSFFYAATTRGFYKGKRNSPNLQLFSAWTPLDTTQNFISAAAVGQKVFAAGKDSLFEVNGNALRYVLSTSNSTTRIDAGKDVLNISLADKSYVMQLDKNLQLTDSFRFSSPRQTTELADGTLWVADGTDGLNKHTGGNNHEAYVPAGPYSFATFDILPYNKEVWIAHGGYRDNWGLTFNRSGISSFKNETWTNYRSANTPYMNEMYDIIDVSRDASGTIYGGSIQEGIAVIKADGTGYRIKRDSLEAKDREPDVFPATSTETDQGGNLWVTQLGSRNELAVRTTDGRWFHYPTSSAFTGGFAFGAAGLIVDGSNQKWYYGPQGRGVIVYNDNHTPETGGDDTYRQFRKGVGFGNLPSERIFCLVEDREGAIWVGTDDGIGIINCASVATDGNCDAELRVVQYDQFPGFLFKEQQVKTIAVDGGNRKWVGTNNGIWLISPDANKIILRFTKENSPLPSNVIQKIAVDPVTGDVYIGTDQGLVSYRGTATEGGTTNSNVITFPNPVPSGYGGTIAIRGLVRDADVRITDIAGQLIYRGKAQGGQLTWSGLDYTGHRPQTGVYLIFATNKDGSQTHIGKMMFNN